MIYNIQFDRGSFHGRPDRCNDRRRAECGAFLDIVTNRGPRGTGGDRNACHQYLAAFAAADGSVTESIDRGGHFRHHGFPRRVRPRPARGRTDLGSLWPALAGADGLCGVLRRQHLVRPRAGPAEPSGRPRHPGRRRLRHLGAVARHCPRSLLWRGARPRDGADHGCDGGGARLLAAARRRARSIRGGLVAAATGSIGVLLVSVFHPTFLPFLAAMSVFLLGTGIVNPLGTAQALSPFGEKAGAASALLGFWQMMGAAIGVYLAATVSHEAMFALGIVVVAASLLAVALYAMRAKSSPLFP